ncbi:MAG: cupredoxin domain-containing protein [Sphingosinicella sp.]
MLRRLLLALALLLAAPATAQEPEWRTAPEYDVLLRPFDYEPDPIRLEAGRPVRLRFVNQGQGTYSFSADDFFRSARIRSGDAERLRSGRLRLAPGERRVIALVPAPGRYSVRSGNLVHWLLGMRATIIVE